MQKGEPQILSDPKNRGIRARGGRKAKALRAIRKYLFF